MKLQWEKRQAQMDAEKKAREEKDKVLAMQQSNPEQSYQKDWSADFHPSKRDKEKRMSERSDSDAESPVSGGFTQDSPYTIFVSDLSCDMYH